MTRSDAFMQKLQAIIATGVDGVHEAGAFDSSDAAESDDVDDPEGASSIRYSYALVRTRAAFGKSLARILLVLCHAPLLSV